MIKGFYTLIETIKTQLESDPNVTTVTSGDFYNIDLKKQTLAPLSHIIVNNTQYNGSTWTFNMTVLAMDIIDMTHEQEDNRDDIINTQWVVLGRLFQVLNSGQMPDGIELDGVPTIEPFIERFENNWAGVQGTFDVIIPNDIPQCDLPDFPSDICLGADWKLINTDGTELQTGSIASGGTADILLPDTFYEIEVDGVLEDDFQLPTLEDSIITIELV